MHGPGTAAEQVDNDMSPWKQFAGLLVWLAVTFAAAAIGAAASVDAAAFYQQLARPVWAPPAAAFAPVWSALYLAMTVAAWLVWRQSGLGGARWALGLFVMQLMVNGLWSWLFFVWRQGALALLDAGALWVLIVATAVAFWRVRRLAGVLMLPYLAWVTFAVALTLASWQLNPDRLGGP